MKFFQTKRLLAIALLLLPFVVLSKELTESKQSVITQFKIEKELFANRNMTFLNSNVVYDSSFRYRTTADGVLIAKYGDIEANPALEVKGIGRFRYDVGTPAIVKTAATTTTVAGTAIAIPSTDVQKTLFFLRELQMKVSLDKNPEGSKNYIKFGSFPYQLGRGISLGVAYDSGGFLDLSPRFSIDQFAPGMLLHLDTFSEKLSADVYYGMLSNPNSSLKENLEIIRQNEIRDDGRSAMRGQDRRVWIVAGALHWKPFVGDGCKLDIDPYAYMHLSPDQSLEFTADSDSQLYAIGSALEYKLGNFELGFDAAFQGGATRIKKWDRNYTNLVNLDGVVTSQYTKVYASDPAVPGALLAVATTANQVIVADSEKNVSQNGKEIETSGLFNAINRFRPYQQQLVHGYFFVLDSAYKINNEFKASTDFGYVSGHLSQLKDLASMTEEQRMKQEYNGFIPVQSVYSGKRIQHLVMLNTGVPRFVVEYPQLPSADYNVASKITGVATLTDKFTNLAYAAGAIEYKPARLADQKLLFKPVCIYYWMPEAPKLLNDINSTDTSNYTQASHALGTALSLQFTATLIECLDVGGFAGLMLPGKQYKQFAGTQLKNGKLGSDIASVVNFSATYNF